MFNFVNNKIKLFKKIKLNIYNNFVINERVTYNNIS